MIDCHLLSRITAASFFLRVRLLVVMGETTMSSVRLFELIVIDRFWNYEVGQRLTRAVRGTKTMSWHVTRVNGCQWCQLSTDVLG